MGQLGDLSPQGSIAVGVIVGLISTSLQAIGLTLQRKSHLLEDEKDPYVVRRPAYKRRRWQLGMFMFVLSNIIGSSIQITTLPLPVLSTLQASGLVFNTIFATLILGEPFTRHSLIGTILVCIGAVLIAIFGAIGEPAHNLDQLIELLSRRAFIGWMVSTAVVMLIVLIGSRILKFLASPSRSKSAKPLIPYAPQIPKYSPRVKLIRGVSFGFVSGILSAHSLLLAKSAVELLVRTIVDRDNQFNRWQSWLILLGMIALALTQLYCMHRGLKLCSTSILYPFVFCIYNIIAILDGLIYFRQVSLISKLHAGLIALGTVVLLGGVLCLSWRLEDIDTHAGVAIVGSSQTALGPGMGLVDEHSQPPTGLGLVVPDEEEGQPAEREPLLQQSRRGPLHQRAPSLPLVSPGRKRTSTLSAESASIWAELDDTEDEAEGDPLAFGRYINRRRSKSGTLPLASRDLVRRSLVNEDSIEPSRLRRARDMGRTRTWDPRRLRLFDLDNSWRRTSPVSMDGTRPQRRRTILGAFLESIGVGNTRPIGYGTNDSPRTTGRPRSQGSMSTSRGILAGPRILADGWRTGLGYLRRWTGRLSNPASIPELDQVPDNADEQRGALDRSEDDDRDRANP
ncbi:hypothetical protein VTN00DRAFT_8992 [Thermoascus crustaceus]|uniref:uncharacterized protein n=1 Tax=Thermoascus crustaceus TaxID=5088 RepID=UPI003742EB11